MLFCVCPLSAPLITNHTGDEKHLHGDQDQTLGRAWCLLMEWRTAAVSAAFSWSGQVADAWLCISTSPGSAKAGLWDACMHAGGEVEGGALPQTTAASAVESLLVLAEAHIALNSRLVASGSADAGHQVPAVWARALISSTC